ncbi:MAG TPA: M20/M25/M40 family metallo-hydrolase, partial [Verrucomicrobiae bacterium]|nr:M20/M25/M40 family metallo-hydrolase [Verrucomicrobiae bacterium]
REPENPFYQIYLLSLENGDLQRVSPGMGKTTCAFFRPGSDQLLFASTHLDPAAQKKQEDERAFIASGKSRRYSWDYDEQMDIFSTTRTHSNFTRLTSAPGYDAEGAYSPDGSKIVFTSLRNAFPVNSLSPEDQKRYQIDSAFFAEIYLMNADGSGQTRLTTNPGYDGGPFFLPDGQGILWRRFETNGMIADLFSMKLDGTDTRRITYFESMSWAPFPHPSGKYIIFTSNKHGFENFELFLVDIEGRHGPVRVSFTEGFDGLPVFSPDGKKLCWTSNRGSNKQSQLFLADWNDAAALAALGLGDGIESSSPVRGNGKPGVQSLSPEIRAEDARQHVNYLASDELEGRKTGEAGARKAAEYIVAQLQHFGVKPLVSAASAGDAFEAYAQRFEFTSGVVLKEGNKLELSSGEEKSTFVPDRDFRPLSFSSEGEIEGDVVFAGYGLSVAGKGAEKYDSYEGLDVTNKIVLLLRYVPEDVEPKRRQELNRYAALRYKAMIARERGAKAVLIVAGPHSPHAGELIPLSSDGTMAGSEIMAASISGIVADKVLAATGKTLNELQSALDSENPHAEKSLALTHTRVRLRVALEVRKTSDKNILAAIPGTSPEFIMIGAHYDHLGFGEGGDSRSNKEEQGKVHNGADDNASGVSAVLELAANYAAQSRRMPPPKRGVIFAFWSGEEIGLLGSSYLAEHPLIPLTNIAAYLNFDMVGRLRDEKLILQGTGSSPIWNKLIEKRNAAAGFDLTLQEDPYQPSDTTSFYPKGIPVLMFFTGNHDDYHRPTDDADKLNYEGIEKITRFARALTDDLRQGNPPAYVKVERSNAPGNRDSLRAYLGTIPDYATEVKGVKFSGVRAGSPAEKAGITGGDILVEFAGQKIANIYDYTYALDAAKIGQALKIKILRHGKEQELTITPEARK